MERKIEKCSLMIMNYLPQILNCDGEDKYFGNEFMVAYYIINKMAMEKNDRVLMYRDEIRHHCSFKDNRTVSKLTNQLVERGLFKKDLVAHCVNDTVNYYCIVWKVLDDFFAKCDKKVTTSWHKCSGLIEERNKKQEQSNKAIKKETELELVCASTENSEFDDDLPFND